MAQHYYITGRERKIRRRVDFSLPCTLVYNEWAAAGPDYAIYFADLPIGSVSPIVLGFWGYGTITPAFSFNATTKKLSYGGQIWYNPAAAKFHKYGEVDAFWRIGDGSGFGGVPTKEEQAAGFHSVSFTMEGYYEQEFDAAELLVGPMTYLETRKPGGTMKSTIAVGSQSYVDIISQSAWTINNNPLYDLRFELKAFCYQYFNGDRDMYPSDYLELFDDACNYSAGIVAHGNAHYAMTPGMVDAAGLVIPSAYGAGEWGKLTIATPPSLYAGHGELSGAGTTPHTLGITGVLRRWANANDQPCDVVLLVNGLINEPDQWPIVTGVTDSFYHEAFGGGYEITGNWGRSHLTGTPAPVGDSGSDDSYPASPVAGYTQIRAAILDQDAEDLSIGFWSAVTQPFLARHPTKVPVMKVRNLTEKVQDGHGGKAWELFVFGTPADGKWQESNATASVIGSGAGSKLRFTPTAPLGGMTKNIGGEVAPGVFKRQYLGHRYWVFRIRSVGSANKVLQLHFFPGVGGWFEVTTGEDGEWVERTIDFFSDPVNTGPAKCQIKAFQFYESEILKGEDGVTYEIEWIKGIRQHDALLSHVRTGLVGQGLSGIHGIVDGMGSLRPIHGLYGINSVLTTIESIKTYTDLNMPWLGWAFDILRPEPAPTFLPISEMGSVGDGWTHSNAAGLFADDSLYLDVDATGEGATWHFAMNYHFISAYPGAGDVVNGGDYDSTIPMRFSIMLHGQVMGCIVPAAGSVSVEESDTSDPSGSGSARPSGFYATGSPYLRVDMPAPPDTPVDQEASCSEGLRYWFDSFHGPPDTESLPAELAAMTHGTRYYLRFHVTPQEGQVIAIDTVRGWLHVGTEAKIRTYHLQTMVLAFDSPDHPVDVWAGLATDQRTGALYLLGVDALEMVVYRSFDGGVSIEEVERVTADTAQIVCDTNRGWTILVFEDGGDIQRRVSRDGGENWDSPAAVTFDGAAEEGEVFDLAVDARSAGQLALIAKIGGDMKIFRSFDGGESWETSIG